jgi:DNA polymerase III subunit beta
MKFVAQAGPFASALALATAGVRASKKKLPALLGAVRLETADGAVLISCSSNYMAISARVEAEVIEPGHVAVPDRLAALTFAAKAELTLSATANNATIVCGNSRSRLDILPWQNLPDPLALTGETASLVIVDTDLLRLLWPLYVVESGPTARHIFSGVFLHNADDLVSVAVDGGGARLMRAKIILAGAGEFSQGRDLIIPALSVQVLSRLLRPVQNREIQLRRSRAVFAVDTDSFSFVTPLIAAQFPEYERLIPASLSNRASCDRAELVASLDRLAAVSTAESPLVALSWSDGGPLNVYLARQPLVGSDAIGAETKGDADIALPLSQLGDMIGNFGSDRIHFETAEGSPLVIRNDGKLALITRSAWQHFRKEEHGAKAVA